MTPYEGSLRISFLLQLLHALFRFPLFAIGRHTAPPPSPHQGALGGASRTTALVCCRGDDAQADETLQALRFGERCSLVTNAAQQVFMIALLQLRGTLQLQLGVFSLVFLQRLRELLFCSSSFLRLAVALLPWLECFRSSVCAGCVRECGGRP